MRPGLTHNQRVLIYIGLIVVNVAAIGFALWVVSLVVRALLKYLAS